MNKAGGKRSMKIVCTKCKRESVIAFGPGVDGDVHVNAVLHLMTGGHSGYAPFPFKKVEPDDPGPVGKSECCGAQLLGEVIEHGSGAPS